MPCEYYNLERAERDGSTYRVIEEMDQLVKKHGAKAIESFCGNCGGAVRSLDRFCEGCGTEQPRAGLERGKSESKN